MELLDELLEQEEKEMRHKSKIEWLTLGDSNTSFFAKKIKERQNVNSMLGNIGEDGSDQSRLKKSRSWI